MKNRYIVGGPTQYAQFLLMMKNASDVSSDLRNTSKRFITTVCHLRIEQDEDAIYTATEIINGKVLFIDNSLDSIVSRCKKLIGDSRESNTIKNRK